MEPASTGSTLGPFAIDDAQGQELVHCAFALDGCTSDAGTGGCWSTFVLLFLFWLFLFVEVEDGVFVDCVATRGLERRLFCPHHASSLPVHEREVECGLDVLAVHNALGEALVGSSCQH